MAKIEGISRQALEATIDYLLDEVDRLRVFERRYQWLVKSNPLSVAAVAWRKKKACAYSVDEVDKAVDAAISQEQKEERWALKDAKTAQ